MLGLGKVLMIWSNYIVECYPVTMSTAEEVDLREGESINLAQVADS